MTNNEECRYVLIDDDGKDRVISKDEIPIFRDMGTVIKIIRHGNGKVTIHNMGGERILEI